jgi:uncharacterized protein (DUF1499 family)
LRINNICPKNFTNDQLKREDFLVKKIYRSPGTPVLVPSDSFLFLTMKDRLMGLYFDSIEEIQKVKTAVLKKFQESDL